MSESPSVINRVVSLLRAASENVGVGATTTELARATQIPRPTTHRLLEALEVEGLVDRDVAGRWFLGPETYVLGVAAAPRYDVTETARECVYRLARETGESAFFSLRRGDHTVVLLREDGDFPIRSYVLYEGARFPLGVVSAGLAVLAYLPDADIDAYLKRADLTSTWGESHSANAIRARIAQTRTDGWALNPGLVVEGSWGMAAAVFDSGKAPIGALTITGIEPRFGADRRAHLGQLLLQQAHRLSQLVAG
jgi:IclR family transcriptional regulator, acetate operon repressor